MRAVMVDIDEPMRARDTHIRHLTYGVSVRVSFLDKAKIRFPSRQGESDAKFNSVGMKNSVSLIFQNMAIGVFFLRLSSSASFFLFFFFVHFLFHFLFLFLFLFFHFLFLFLFLLRQSFLFLRPYLIFLSNGTQPVAPSSV